MSAAVPLRWGSAGVDEAGASTSATREETVGARASAAGATAGARTASRDGAGAGASSCSAAWSSAAVWAAGAVCFAARLHSTQELFRSPPDHEPHTVLMR